MNPSELLSRVASLAPSAITKPEPILTEHHTALLRWNPTERVWIAKVGVWSEGLDGYPAHREAKYRGIEGESADETLRNALQKLALAGV